MDPLKLQNSVEVAELRFIYSFLGSGLYSGLVAAKNMVVDSANKASLQALFNAQHAGGQVPQLREGQVVNAAEFLGAADRALWDQHLWKYLAEAVYAVAIPGNFAQFTSEGIMKNNPVASTIAVESTKSVGVTLGELKFLQEQQMQLTLDPLRIALHDYLCLHLADFATYPGPCAGCGDAGAVSGSKMTSWVTDIYNDDPPCCL